MTQFLGLDYVTNLSFEDVKQEYIQDASNFKRNALITDAQRWGFTIGLVDTHGAKRGGAKLQSHYAKHGHHTSFQLPCPLHMGIVVPVGTKNATGAVGSDMLTMTGSEEVEDGTFMTIGTDPKVYLATATDATTISVYPNLRQAASGAAINFAPMLTCYYAQEYLGVITITGGVVLRHTIIVDEKV